MNKFDIGAVVVVKKFKDGSPLAKLWKVIALQINKDLKSTSISYKCKLDSNERWFKEEDLI